MPNPKCASFTDYAAAKLQVGIIRDAALFSGFGPASARAFSDMLDRMIGKRNAETARPASAPAQQTNLF
jgi:hypothetical protein